MVYPGGAIPRDFTYTLYGEYHFDKKKKTVNLNAMKYLLTLSFLLSVFALTSSAQVTEEEMNDLLNSNKIQIENPVIHDFVSMTQIQEDFATTIRNSGLSTEIIQTGNNNNTSIEQTGSGLKTVVVQDGSFNEANVQSEGNNILTSVKQEGERNVINSYIKNYHLESRTARLLQVGDDNNITLDLREAGVPESFEPQEFKITQTGNNHEATITGIDFNSPITIDQTGGTGMQIEINTSYFTFPMGN